MSKKKHKIIIIGLPKTGTSTLTVMLRILNYKVTGPNIKYNYGDTAFLLDTFNSFDAFQDYPWCFEWEIFKKNDAVKFIILKRESESWWKSFYESYDGKGQNYLSYPYFKISKNKKNKSLFLNYFRIYYLKAEEFKANNPERVLSINIDSFQWQNICSFLNEDLPTNIFGKVIQKPHINKLNSKKKKSTVFKFKKKIKEKILYVLGEKNYGKLILFFRRNGILKT